MVKIRVKEIHDRSKKIKDKRIFVMGDVISPLWGHEEADDKGRILLDALIHLRLTTAINPCLSTAKINHFTGEYRWIDMMICDQLSQKLITRREGMHIANSDHPMLLIDSFKDLYIYIFN